MEGKVDGKRSSYIKSDKFSKFYSIDINVKII